MLHNCAATIPALKSKTDKVNIVDTIETPFKLPLNIRHLARDAKDNGLKVHYQFMHNVFVDAAIEIAINEGMGK